MAWAENNTQTCKYHGFTIKFTITSTFTAVVANPNLNLTLTLKQCVRGVPGSDEINHSEKISQLINKSVNWTENYSATI